MVATLNLPRVMKSHASADAMIQGRMLKVLSENSHADLVQPALAGLMTEYGYDATAIADEAWYPLNMILELNQRLVECYDYDYILQDIGVSMAASMTYADAVHSIPSAIQALDELHHQALVNVPAYDGYHSIVVSDNRVAFVEQTAFPHNFMYGFIYGLAMRFCAPGSYPVVTRLFLNPHEPNSDGAFYEITW